MREFARPFVAAIIERQHKGKLQLLMQVRQNSYTPSIYDGTLEFPAGTLDKLYENVYDTLKREIREETGLTLKCVLNDSQTEIHAPTDLGASFGFRPFCCTQQLREGYPWVGFIFRCQVEDGEPVAEEGETQDVRWMDAAEVKQLFETEPEKLFGLEVPAWEYYFSEVEV